MKKSSFTKKKVAIWLASGAAAIGFTLGAANLVSAEDQPTADSNSASAAMPLMETPVEGDNATQLEAAVLAAEPTATIERLETDSSGHAYEAHITLEDGTHKILFFNANFEFEGEELPPAGHGPHDGKHEGRRGGCRDELQESTDTTAPLN